MTVTKHSQFRSLASVPLLFSLAGTTVPAAAADKALLDILPFELAHRIAFHIFFNSFFILHRR